MWRNAKISHLCTIVPISYRIFAEIAAFFGLKKLTSNKKVIQTGVNPFTSMSILSKKAKRVICVTKIVKRQIKLPYVCA